MAALGVAALEFALDGQDARALARWGGMVAGRARAVSIGWHDTVGGGLAARNACLVSEGGAWVVAALRPGAAVGVGVLGVEEQVALLGGVPEGLVERGRFEGTRRVLRWGAGEDGVVVTLLEGRFVVPKRRLGGVVCRVRMEGAAGAVGPLAVALAGDLGLRVPLHGFAEEAVAAGSGVVLAPRALGAPQVAGGQTVSESLAVIVGHLTDVMLHWGALAPDAFGRGGRGAEPVHQMRVATRRLRSALSVYKGVAGCGELAGLSAPLRFCAARLGVARDWDVFLGGLGARLGEAFPEDARCRGMLRAAARRRRGAYDELRSFLAGPDFRTMSVALGCAAALRPWEAAAADGVALGEDAAVFAAQVLGKRMKRVRQAGRGIEGLTVPALHELRKDCKRLRYAAEFFAPLFPAKRVKRFGGPLSELQEELGLLNDGAAVSGLMAQLGRLERSYAAGLVEGFSAAHAGAARGRIEAAWRRFKGAPRFW